MTKLERIIVSFKPIRFVLNRTKHIVLPGFQKLPLYDVIVFYYNQIKSTAIGQRASSISYNLIIAIPAAFLFLFSIVPHLPRYLRDNFSEELFKLITAYFTPTPATETWIRNSLNDFLNTQRGTLSLLGFLLVTWATSNAMLGIMKSFDHTIVLKKDKNVFQHRWTAVKLTTLLMMLVIATVFLLISEGRLLKIILHEFNLESSTVRIIIKTLDWVIFIALSVFSIGCIYRYAPSIHKRWHIITPGSILSTLLILLTTFIFSFWMNRFGSYNKLYGSIGTVLILMLLIYFNSIVLLLGFELNNSITHLKQTARLREKREEEEKAAHSV
ncbi:MAG: YihY/virulence factor BrkB family protein [Dinghuibacter sp.]|nr:YihY/virulence factor BrkB family protein [Dinghuibacter sp.]